MEWNGSDLHHLHHFKAISSSFSNLWTSKIVELLVVHATEPCLILHIYSALYYSMAMYYLYMHLHIFFLLQQKPHIQNPLVATLQPL